MNRREAIHGLGALALGATMQSAAWAGSGRQQNPTPTQPAAPPLPSEVAGIRMVDSKIARTATDLSRSFSPPYLILHDLGLTERFEGDLPFEIQGAEVAKRFLQEQAYSQEKSAVVWDGIAMHASRIGQFKQPEIALVGEGAGADVLGPDFTLIKKSDVDEILRAFPRLKFKNAFVKTCADVVRKHPRAASQTFMRDIRDRYMLEFRAPNFCDWIAQAPFSE